MASQRFLIAPYNETSGVTTNVRPWQIPDNAFSTLENAYVFRGRVRKRQGSRYFNENGSQLNSRLRVKVDTSDGGGSSSGTVPGSVGAIGQMFSIGTNIYTVYQLNGSMLIDGIASTATFNTATGVFVFTGVPAGTSVYWYPSLPVTGLISIDTPSINIEPIVGFDTHFAYTYNGSAWERLNLGASIWSTNDDSKLMWGVTWNGQQTGHADFEPILYVTNFDETDPNYMRYLLVNSSTWVSFRPQVNSTQYVNSCRIIVVFQNRLLLLNTWEGTGIGAGQQQNYQNRVRWSQISTSVPPMSPINPAAFLATAYGDNALDASTTEAIVAAEFIKNRLIVFFEKSTWELVYTANQATPFTWQKINTELGSESTFSTIPFDKQVLTIGNTGIHECNGANVQRIDDKIPQEVFEILDGSSAPERVFGIRDYYQEMAFWSCSLASNPYDPNNDFNDKLLVYNYKIGTWSIYDDSITVFGYYSPINGITWSSETVLWGSDTQWSNTADQPFFRQIVAGNQQGFTFIIDDEIPTNSQNLQITNVTTAGLFINLNIINHNFQLDSFIYINDCAYSDSSNVLNNQIFKITNIVDSNNVLIAQTTLLTGTYTGGGTAGLVSKMTIKTKEYNFFAEQGRNAYISKIDFMVDRSDGGQLTVNYFVSTNQQSFLQDSIANQTIVGTGNLDTFPYTAMNAFRGVVVPLEYEANSERLWHPVFFQAEGEVISFQLTMNDEQMMDTENNASDFQLHAMLIHATPTSSRLQ